MNKLRKILQNGSVMASAITAFSLVFSIIGANSRCCCIFHQPEKPDLKKLRRF